MVLPGVALVPVFDCCPFAASGWPVVEPPLNSIATTEPVNALFGELFAVIENPDPVVPVMIEYEI